MWSKYEGVDFGSGQSVVTLEVKPWDDETDMKALEDSVRSIEMDGGQLHILANLGRTRGFAGEERWWSSRNGRSK